MNIWEGHRLILIYHCQFQIIFHSPVGFCGSNSGICVITIASNVGICALDVVVSDNKVTITGRMILRWSWVINIVLFCKLYVIHLLKMLYSSNLSLCESSGKNIECTLLLLWHYPSLNLPAWYIGGKTTIPVLVLPYEEYFTYSWVGDTAWLGLSEATQIPCEMWMALSVIFNSNSRCCITEWPREEIAWILLSVQRVEWPGTLLLIAKRNVKFYVGHIYWCSVECNSHDLKGMQHES